MDRIKGTIKYLSLKTDPVYVLNHDKDFYIEEAHKARIEKETRKTQDYTGTNGLDIEGS
jgi:hypothetical protein